MPTGKLTTYELTSGVIVSIEPMIFLLDPIDVPLLGGQGADGLSVLATSPVTQVKHEWQDEELLTPRSTLAAAITTGTAYITVASGDQINFSTGDALVVENETLRVTQYGSTTDTLEVTRAFAGTTAVNHNTSVVVVGVGTALAEGSDPQDPRMADRTRRYNLTQIFGPTMVHLSRTAQKVARYGVDDEFAHQMMRRVQENAISREQAILYGVRTESTTTKIRTMGGFKYYITSNVNSTATQLTVTSIQTGLQSNYNAGGVPDRLTANPVAFTDLTDVANTSVVRVERDDAVRGRAAAMAVDTQFGRVTLIPNRWVRLTDAFAWKREQVRRGVFDPLQFERLAKTGDSDKAQIVCEETLIFEGERQAYRWSALGYT